MPHTSNGRAARSESSQAWRSRKIRQDARREALACCACWHGGFNRSIFEMNRRALAAQVAEEEIVFNTVLKRFDRPDEVRTFEKGKFELVHIGGMTIGRATYEPGWKWSEHVGGRLHRRSCDVEHVGIVIAGRATAAMDDGRVIEMGPGEYCHFAVSHYCRMIGAHPDAALYLMGPTYDAHSTSDDIYRLTLT